MTCRNSSQLWNSAIQGYLVCYLIPSTITFKMCQEHTCICKKKMSFLEMSTFSEYLFSFEMNVHVGLTTGFFFICQDLLHHSKECLKILLLPPVSQMLRLKILNWEQREEVNSVVLRNYLFSGDLKKSTPNTYLLNV